VRDRWLWLGCLLYAALFTLLGWIKYTAHNNLVDFGIFAQTAASAFGCFCNPVEGSHWAFHFSPILYVPGVVLGAWKSPIVLIVMQSIACALTAPPIYAIVRSRAPVTIARCTALVVLLYPPLAGLAFVDFHENAFAPAAVAWLLWSFDEEYFSIAVLFAAITLAIKEDQALFLSIAGIIGAIAYGRVQCQRKSIFSAAVAVVSVIVAAVFFLIIQPHAALSATIQSAMHWQPTLFYNWSSYNIHALFFRGIIDRFGFLVLVFAPLAFIPLRSRWSILAIPPLAEVLFSTMSTTHTMGTHYAGAWIGYIVVAFGMGIRELSTPKKQQTVLTWAICLCAATFIAANPLHPHLNLRTQQPRDTALDTFLAKLPPSLPIATQEEAFTHIALINPHATVLPELATIPLKTCYALTDTDFPTSPRLQEYLPALLTYEHNQTYTVIKHSNNITLYHSKSCHYPRSE